VVRTRRWEGWAPRRGNGKLTEHDVAAPVALTKQHNHQNPDSRSPPSSTRSPLPPPTSPLRHMLDESRAYAKAEATRYTIGNGLEVWDMRLGPSTADVARGLFSALRDLDREEVDCILVEGIDDGGSRVSKGLAKNGDGSENGGGKRVDEHGHGLVDGDGDSDGDIAAAVMNRLRKAAEVKVD